MSTKRKQPAPATPAMTVCAARAGPEESTQEPAEVHQVTKMLENKRGDDSETKMRSSPRQRRSAEPRAKKSQRVEEAERSKAAASEINVLDAPPAHGKEVVRERSDSAADDSDSKMNSPRTAVTSRERKRRRSDPPPTAAAQHAEQAAAAKRQNSSEPPKKKRDKQSQFSQFIGVSAAVWQTRGDGQRTENPYVANLIVALPGDGDSSGKRAVAYNYLGSFPTEELAAKAYDAAARKARGDGAHGARNAFFGAFLYKN
jgi:hypothetical protein